MNKPKLQYSRLDAKRKHAAHIAVLNDQLRQLGVGGSIMMTRGISDLDPEIRQQVIAAVRDFDTFTPDNDPHHEHDCAVLDVNGNRIIWKIDAYDRSMRVASPGLTDPKVTHRVLTIMLADEY